MIVHAAGESSPGNLPEDTYAVVLAAWDELHIALIADALEARGVALTRVRETEPPYSGALMALGLAPARKETLRRHVSQLPLLR